MSHSYNDILNLGLTVKHEHEFNVERSEKSYFGLITDIHTKLQQIESNTEGGGTLHLSNSIKQVEDVANRAFSPLLERQVHHLATILIFSL